MKNNFIIAVFLLIASSFPVFSSSPDQLMQQVQTIQGSIDLFDSDNENAKFQKDAIRANISIIESFINKKIRKIQKRLERDKCWQCTSTDLNSEHAQKRIKKIASREKEIYDLNEILFTIEMLKLKLIN